ncbi:protein kinase domain-containing protein [Pseudomonas chlororaphis]|uniref:protein kinase domain-containing protein n=1 Tax=Pseudomonas chlororaphis TaxID=587753 RepID=UPI002D7930F5|nr:protein kinase [Pseudomonas chlororaphis]
MEAMTEPNAAYRLTGLTLKNGWVVGERLKTGTEAGGSGGFFSVSYAVSKDGRTAFLKAFDLVKALKRGQAQGRSLVSILGDQAKAFTFETDLHDLCAGAKLRRVVRIIDHGEVDVPPEGHEQILQIPYMIMELADGGDVRGYLGKNTAVDLEMKLTYLKDVVLGLFQLHGVKIAHQDLKPSNVMIFGEVMAKVGDLGRASSQDHVSLHDNLDVAGDKNYAPPEQLYGYPLVGWLDRRMRCDLYQFASVIVFVFFGRTLNNALFEYLPQDIKPAFFHGTCSSYDTALPFLLSSFDTAISEWETQCPIWLGKDLMQIIRQAGHPDYLQRGARKALRQSVPQLGLDRFVSEFQRLILRASIEARKEASRAIA